jgi:hypothetical protein
MDDKLLWKHLLLYAVGFVIGAPTYLFVFAALDHEFVPITFVEILYSPIAVSAFTILVAMSYYFPILAFLTLIPIYVAKKFPSSCAIQIVLGIVTALAVSLLYSSFFKDIQ